MNCQEAEMMILQGETSAGLAAHLAECRTCAELADSCAELRVIREERTLPDVPEHLDSAVRFAARSAIVTGRLRPRTGRSFHLFRITAAAATVILAAALALVFHTEEKTAQTVNTHTVASANVPSFAEIDPFAAFDSELLTLSLEIDRTAVAYADSGDDIFNY